MYKYGSNMSFSNPKLIDLGPRVDQSRHIPRIKGVGMLTPIKTIKVVRMAE